MIQELFSNRAKTVTGAALLLGVASLASRMIGLIRDRIFAHTFGAGELLDAYYAAFRIPDLVYNLLVLGALSAGFIPLFLSAWEKDKANAWRVTSVIMNLLGALLLVVCGVLFVLTPRIMPYLVPGFGDEALRLSTMLTRVMLFSPMILGISSIISSVLQSFKLFFIYSMAPIVYNVGIILGAVFFVPVFGPIGLAYGVILGTLLHLAIQIPSLLGAGFRYSPNFSPDRTVRKIAGHMIPRLLSLAAHQINFIVATALASTVGVGSIAVFHLATNLQYIPVGIIGVSFAVAAFPTLSAFAAKKDMSGFVAQLGYTIRVILFFIIPLTTAFLLLRAQIVRVTLGSGNFDWTATIMTADTLAFFALSLFAQCLVLLLVRAFFALQDTWTPLFISIATMVAHVTMSILLKPVFGVPGLAFAFSFATTMQVALLWIMLRRKTGHLEETKVLRALYKISIAAILMGFVIQTLKTPLAAIVDMTRFWGVFTQGAVAGLAGLVVYGVVCAALRLEELAHLIGSFKKRFLRVREVQSEVDLSSNTLS